MNYEYEKIIIKYIDMDDNIRKIRDILRISYVDLLNFKFDKKNIIPYKKELLEEIKGKEQDIIKNMNYIISEYLSFFEKMINKKYKTDIEIKEYKNRKINEEKECLKIWENSSENIKKEYSNYEIFETEKRDLVYTVSKEGLFVRVKINKLLNKITKIDIQKLGYQKADKINLDLYEFLEKREGNTLQHLDLGIAVFLNVVNKKLENLKENQKDLYSYLRKIEDTYESNLNTRILIHKIENIEMKIGLYSYLKQEIKKY